MNCRHHAFRHIAAILLAGVPFAAAASPSENWVPTSTTVPDLSAAAPGDMMRASESLHIVIALKIHNKAGLDAVTSGTAVGNGASENSLTSQQFLDRYAPSQSQVDSVVQYLELSGCRNANVAANRLLVEADCSVGTMGIAFRVSMRHFTVAGRDAHANLNTPLVPARLGDIILSIGGLQNVTMAHTLRRHRT